MHVFCGVLKEHKDYFVALNVDVYDLVSHSAWKGDATFCEYGCTLAPPIIYIYLHVGWSMVNVKSWYLKYKVLCNQFCVWIVSGQLEGPNNLSASIYLYTLKGFVVCFTLLLILRFISGLWLIFIFPSWTLPSQVFHKYSSFFLLIYIY